MHQNELTIMAGVTGDFLITKFYASLSWDAWDVFSCHVIKLYWWYTWIYAVSKAFFLVAFWSGLVIFFFSIHLVRFSDVYAKSAQQPYVRNVSNTSAQK